MLYNVVYICLRGYKECQACLGPFQSRHHAPRDACRKLSLWADAHRGVPDALQSGIYSSWLAAWIPISGSRDCQKSSARCNGSHQRDSFKIHGRLPLGKGGAKIVRVGNRAALRAAQDTEPECTADSKGILDRMCKRHVAQCSTAKACRSFKTPSREYGAIDS